MTVYVDDMKAPYGRLIMCHMVADSSEELLAMARTIGIELRWLQKPGTWEEHFDIALSKRKLAIENGAVEVGMMELGRMLLRKRKGLPFREAVELKFGEQWGHDDDGD